MIYLLAEINMKLLFIKRTVYSSKYKCTMYNVFDSYRSLTNTRGKIVPETFKRIELQYINKIEDILSRINICVFVCV